MVVTTWTILLGPCVAHGTLLLSLKYNLLVLSCEELFQTQRMQSWNLCDLMCRSVERMFALSASVYLNSVFG